MSYKLSIACCLILILSSFVVKAEDPVNTVKFLLPENYDYRTQEVYVTNSSTHGLFAESNSDGGTDSGSPVKVYVPIVNGDATVNEADFSIFPDSGALPVKDGGDAAVGTITLNLDVTNSDTTERRVCAITDTDISAASWKYIETTSSRSNIYNSAATSENVDFTVLLSGIVDAGTVIAENSGNDEFFVYFYLRTDDCVGGEGQEPDDVPGGTYIQFFISTVVPSDKTVVLSDISSRDEQAIARIASTVSFVDTYKTAVYGGDVDIIGTPLGTGDTVGTHGNLLYMIYDYVGSGDLTIKELENGKSYHFAIAQVNKYLFATPLSEAHSVDPQSFEELLDKQGCYLLTAGFQEEHYVLNYFRDIRDRILLKHKWGRMFVSWYYSTAPKYALMIYKSRVASNLIKGVGYTAYYFLNYFFKIILAIFLLTFIMCWYKILGSAKKPVRRVN